MSSQRTDDAVELPARSQSTDVSPHTRPADPAGTRPRVDPASLEPAVHHAQLALDAGELVGTQVIGPGMSAVGETASASAAMPAVRTEKAGSIHSSRFQFLYGALGALGVAAIVLTVLLLSRPDPAPSVPWSSWRPSAGGGDPAEQIAIHIGSQYKLPNGHQLVGVTGGPQAVGGQPVVLALRSSGSEPAALPGNGVFYELCGTGPSCSIPGKASVERGLLVSREALELALYTFHYIEEASQVVVTFPPPPPSKDSKRSTGSTTGLEVTRAGNAKSTTSAPNHVLLFRPADLQAELSRPLQKTLPADTPTVKTMNASPDAALVSRLAKSATYDSTLTQQESTLVMLLQTPSIGG